MTRHVLIRADGGAQHVVPETDLPLEANLHDALTEYPQLVPAQDLGLGRTVVVGRESTFESGYADLILLDDAGRLCLVEVKKEGNPDARKVVAQLLDYAASLWGQTLDGFERSVLSPYLASSSSSGSSLREFLVRAFFEPPDGSVEEVEASAARAAEVEASLEATLQRGDFLLVVAAPEIPAGVERVLRYMNARGLRLYGLEVSYFNGPAECFVPRLVVQPEITTLRQAAGGARPWNEESILEDLASRAGPEAAEVARRLFGWAHARGLRLWFGTGAKDGSCYVGLDAGDGRYFRPFSVWSNGQVEIEFGEAISRKHSSFASEAKRRELQVRLNSLPGVTIPDDRLGKYPSFPLVALREDSSRTRFTEIIDWALAECEVG